MIRRTGSPKRRAATAWPSSWTRTTDAAAAPRSTNATSRPEPRGDPAATSASDGREDSGDRADGHGTSRSRDRRRHGARIPATEPSRWPGAGLRPVGLPPGSSVHRSMLGDVPVGPRPARRTLRRDHSRPSPAAPDAAGRSAPLAVALRRRRLHDVPAAVPLPVHRPAARSRPVAAATRGTLVHAVLERLFDLPGRQRTPEAPRRSSRRRGSGLLEAEPELARAVRRRARRRAPGAECRSAGAADAARAPTSQLEDPTRLEPADRELPWSRPSSTTGSAARLRRPARRRPRRRDCGWSTTRPARRRATASSSKAMFQMRFYALVLWRLRRRGPAAAAAALPRRRRGRCATCPTSATCCATERKVGALGRPSRAPRRAATGGPAPSRLCDWCDHRALCPAWGGTPPPLPRAGPGRCIRQAGPVDE